MTTQKTPDLDEFVRIAIYEHFVQHATPPNSRLLARQLMISDAELAASYQRLAEQHALVLDASDQVWMAIPFSAVPTDVVVETPEQRWWANCAFDGLGIPAMLGIDATVDTSCPHSKQFIQVAIRDGVACSDDCVLHMSVPLREWWDNIGNT